MAAGVNKCFFVGNLGRDVEVRYTQGGMAIARLTLACTERQKVGDNWEDKTEWVPVKVFGKLAENCGKFLSKGRQVHVEGRYTTSEYTGSDGVKKYSTEIIAREVLFLGDGKSQGGQRSAPSSAPAGGGAPAGETEPAGDASFLDDDDLPF